jgi:hypothetical protein
MKARMMAPVCDGLRRHILAAEVVRDEEQQRVAEPLRNNQSRSAGRHGGGNRRHLVCPALIRSQTKLGSQFSWSCWLNQMECVPASIATRTRARSAILFHSGKSSAKQSRFTT